MHFDVFLCAVELIVAYYFVCILYPSFILKPFLKDRDLVFRVAFSQIAMLMYITFWGFILGYLKIYSSLILWITLILLPLLLRAFFARHYLSDLFWGAIKFKDEVAEGLWGPKILRRKIFNSIKNAAKKFYDKYLKGNILQYIFFGAVIVFIFYFYGNYKLHNDAYAYTDEETHLYWIQSLVHGTAFPVGLYPHTMHFLVAALSVMFGLSVPIAWHVFNLLSTTLIVLTLYLVARTVFSSKTAPCIAISIYLLANFLRVITYYRFQYSLPMEFGSVSLFFFIISMLYVVKQTDRLSFISFTLSLALTFQVHFYVTIVAVFICIAGAIVYGIRMIREKYFHKVIIAGLLSVVLMVTPFAVGYLCGYEFERSIAWGLDIMGIGDGSSSIDGTETTSNTFVYTEDMAAEELEEVTEQKNVMTTNFFDIPDEEKEAYISLVTGYKVDKVTGCRYLVRNASSPRDYLAAVTVMLCYYIFNNWKMVLFALALLVFVGVAGLSGLIYCLIKKKKPYLSLSFLFVSIMWGFMVIIHVMPILGMTALLEVSRSAEIVASTYTLLYCVPVEILIYSLGKIPKVGKFADPVLYAGALVFALLLFKSPYSKQISNLYYNFAVQNMDIRLCTELLENGEDFKWTVVSPVNDLSMIRYQGYHYEIIDILDEMEMGQDIYITTEDIYIVVEENVVNLGYGDRRAVDGSDYVALSRHVEPDYVQISLRDLGMNQWVSRDRAYYDARLPVMSKIYYWVQELMEVYPSEISLYMRDENCAVYHIRQDPYFLLNLNVDYQNDKRITTFENYGE